MTTRHQTRGTSLAKARTGAALRSAHQPNQGAKAKATVKDTVDKVVDALSGDKQ